MVEIFSTGFLSIADRGCGMTLDLDLATGYVFLSGYADEWINETSQHHVVVRSTIEALSLEDWLECKLRGPLSRLYERESEVTPDMVAAAGAESRALNGLVPRNRIDLE
jgi:hypothetical protein